MLDPASKPLEREARRLQTACSIIQAIHTELSLHKVVEGIVTSLVDVGGFASARLSIEATIENVHLAHTHEVGSIGQGDPLRHETPVFIRGIEVGSLVVGYRCADTAEEQGELLEFILPTLFMGIDHAVSFAEVLDYRETLERKVVERTAQLNEANQQLAKTFDELRAVKLSRDRFFANINHEIRTPLTLIQLAADEIGRSSSVAGSGVQQRIEEIGAATRRLLHLVNSLLQLAAGDEGKLQIRPRALDAAACLQRLVRDWNGAAMRGGIDLRYSGPETCSASLDEAALDTIVGNFVSNATKFTPRGGRITVSLASTGDQLTVAVRDTGPGIDREFLPKLFGRFERSEAATKGGVRGTGIGLSLSKELVELQRGKIDVLTHDDPRGTSFIVTLPRHQAAVVVDAEIVKPALVTAEPMQAAPSAPAPAAPRTQVVEATIVLAEDDPALSAHITRILSARYSVHAAPNGREALELARRYLPDMLVTDLEMPEMNGIELTKRFLELDGMSISPVLIVSAHAGLGQRLAGFDAGAVDYVLKPFSAEELLARVRSQLAMRRLALKLHESQKLAAMGMLSAGLAHELRNPANAVVNALEPLYYLLPESERGPESGGTLLYQVMSAAATQMRDRCANILEFSRTGAVPKRAEQFRTLLARARLVLVTQLAPLEVKESIALDGPILCAGALVEQVLINLLDNAAHAAGPKGWVSVTAKREGEVVAIEVADSGPGVPVELHDRIFDPFFTTKPVGEGTGLGLSVSRRIALNHGGDLRVVRRGERCVFRLELPQAY